MPLSAQQSLGMQHAGNVSSELATNAAHKAPFVLLALEALGKRHIMFIPD